MSNGVMTNSVNNKIIIEIPKLPATVYVEVETHSSSPDGEIRTKIRLPFTVIDRINNVIDRLNLLSRSRIIKSALALEEGIKNEEKKD